MTSLDVLGEVREPCFMQVVCSAGQAYELAWQLARRNVVARVLRGAKMQSVDDLFDEAGAAFQFPNYFGENWAALDECFADLSWMPGAAYVVVVTDSPFLLAKAAADDLRVLLRVLAKVASEWATPVHVGEAWDRAAVPFHVVLQCETEAQETEFSRLATAGATLDRIIL